MPVFCEQQHDGYRLTVRPNCALSWRATKWLVAFFGLVLTLVAGYFLALGAWLVVPFAGLELLVLGAGFYLSALAGHRREVIEVGGSRVGVLRGGRRLGEVASLERRAVGLEVRRDPRGWYPSRLMLTGPDGRVEVGAALTEPEREALLAELRAALGGVCGGDPLPGPRRVMASPPLPEAVPTWPGIEVPASAGLTLPAQARTGR